MTQITTNEQACQWFTDTLHVPRGTWDKLERFEALLLMEMDQQNLIAASTVDSLWARHFVDSAQLMLYLDGAEQGPWIDLGAGAGLPGIVIAILDPERPVHLVESRALRCAFLEKVATDLELNNVTVHHSRLELVESFPASIISARAFAPLDKLLRIAQPFATEKTRWLLPKGKNAVNELELTSKAWQRLFHVEHSLTDAESRILVGTGTIVDTQDDNDRVIKKALPKKLPKKWVANKKFAAMKIAEKKNAKRDKIG